MKRYRHYKHDKAIVLSCFGSIVEQQKYLDLKENIQNIFKDCEVFLSFSSRMVLKELNLKSIIYKNLPQTLSDIDLLGFRNIIVCSVNLFPTDEHQVVKKIVNGFSNFSLSNIRYTKAILSKTKEATIFLEYLNKKVSLEDSANLYIIHGTPTLELSGIESINYATNYLEFIKNTNYTCSLEGAYPYYAIKDQLISKMKNNNIKSIQIIPMLLVSGNHYYHDIINICDELKDHFNTTIAKSLNNNGKFNILEIEMIREIIINNIKEEITKLGQ